MDVILIRCLSGATNILQGECSTELLCSAITLLFYCVGLEINVMYSS